MHPRDGKRACLVHHQCWLDVGKGARMAAPLNYTGQTREEDLRTLGSALYFAAGLSLVAALLHLWVMPEHFEEWWGYGTFFLVVSVAQAVYVALLLGRPAVSFFVLGIGG